VNLRLSRAALWSYVEMKQSAEHEREISLFGTFCLKKIVGLVFEFWMQKESQEWERQSFRSRELRDVIQVNETALLSSAVYGFVRYILRKWICNFVFKILQKKNDIFGWIYCYGKKYIQNKQSSVMLIKRLCARCENWWWKVMMPWKRQVPRGTKNVAQRIKITLSRRIGNKLRVREKQWVKESERKTMSESEVNERETSTHW
jgi:hypothetical protein